ncbi:MAG: zeta toxin family protein [Chitinophagaceae bacterium]
MPDLYIITGSNGAGKSSVGPYYLPDNIKKEYEVFDGDKLFSKKRKELFKVKTQSLKEAKQLATDWLHEEFERRVSDAISKKDHFVYEGHLPEKDNWKTPLRFKKAGYRINLIFLGLTDTNISYLRVLERAKIGGHNVPPYEIERNYYGNLHQLNNHYSIIDYLEIHDTSVTPILKPLAIFKKGKVEWCLPVKELPLWFEDELPDLFQLAYEKNNPLEFEE